MKLSLRPRSLFSKLMLTHLVVVLFTLVVIGIFLTYLMERYFFGMREWEMAVQAENAAFLIEKDLLRDDLRAIEKTVRTLGISLDAKMLVLNRFGKEIAVFLPEDGRNVIGDSDKGVGLEEAEIAQLLAGNIITKKVYGPRVQRLLVAAPVFEGEEKTQLPEDEQAEIIGAITLSVPLLGVQETLARISRLIFQSGAIAALIACALAFSLAKKITRPLQEIKKAVSDMASGLHQRIEVTSDDEIGRVAHTFNIAVEQVEKTLEEQSRLEILRRNLVANISHELRGPLTSMRGFTEIMLDGLLKEDEKEKYLRIILAHTLHLSRLVDDLLQLSNLESGTFELRCELIFLQGVAEFSFQSVVPAAKEKGIIMHRKIDPLLPEVRADRSRLHEALRNLLDNALQHTPPGGEVYFHLYRSREFAVFEVRDTGSGIPEEDRQYIWDRFYKVDKARNRGSKGTGLGLAITRQLVELHGGTIELESDLGRGSTFKIYIPLDPSPGEHSHNSA